MVARLAPVELVSNGATDDSLQGDHMRIVARGDELEVKVGPRFRRLDATRLDAAVEALGTFTRLTIDFGGVHDCDDAALVLLATLLRGVRGGPVELSGLTHHHWRLLAYAGLYPDRRSVAPGAHA